MREVLRERADRGLPVFADELELDDILWRACGCKIRYVGLSEDRARFRLEYVSGLLCSAGCNSQVDELEPGDSWECEANVEVRYVSAQAQMRESRHTMYYRDDDGVLHQYRGRINHDPRNRVRDAL